MFVVCLVLPVKPILTYLNLPAISERVHFVSIILKIIDVFSWICLVTFWLMWNCVCVFKPSGKGKRLPEVHCIVSKLGCFNLFAKVSEVHKRPLPSSSFMEKWKAVAVAETGRVSELLSLNSCVWSKPVFPKLAKWNVKPVRVNTSRWWSRWHTCSCVLKWITCSLRDWNHLSA